MDREAQLKDIINRGKIRTFQELAAQGDLMIVNGWRYGQLLHFVRSLPGPLREEVDYRPKEKLFCRDIAKRNISAFYKILPSSGGPKIPPFIKKWEEEGAFCDRGAVRSILGATHGTAADMKMTESN